MNSVRKVRLTVDCTPEAYKLVARLASLNDVSMADVLRRGIALMKVAADAQRKDRRLAVVDHNDQLVSEIKGLRG